MLQTKLRRLVPLLLTFVNIACRSDYIQPQFSPQSVSIPPKSRTDWPTHGWATLDLRKSKLNEATIENAFSYAFENYPTNALVVIKDGRLVKDAYRAPYARDKKHYTWSISKSFTDALFGRAEQMQLLNRSDRVGKFLAEFDRDENYRKITIDHLLRMKSGLSWKETYEFNPLFSDVLKMLYGSGQKDMGSFAANKPLRTEPGGIKYYSSGTSNLLCLILKKAIGNQREYSNFPWKELFEPLGIQSATWEQDGSGTFVCSSYLYLTALDLAKFGFLYINNGHWENQQLLPETWTMTSTTDTFARRGAWTRSAYGSHWYMNFNFVVPQKDRPLTALPTDTFYATGHWGQWLVVVPSLDMIVVRYGDDKRTRFNMNEFLTRLLAAWRNS